MIMMFVKPWKKPKFEASANQSKEWITDISSMQKNTGYLKSRDHIAAFIDEYGEDSDILDGR